MFAKYILNIPYIPHPVCVKGWMSNQEGHHLCPWEVHNLGLWCFQILLNGKCVAMGISTRHMWTDLRARCDSKVWRYFHKPHRPLILLSNHTGYLMIYFNLFLLTGSFYKPFLTLTSLFLLISSWLKLYQSFNFCVLLGLLFGFLKHFQSHAKVSSTVPFKH